MRPGVRLGVRLGAIVLAAGAGTRFGGDKLSASFRGEPLIAHAIRAARAAPVERIVVVSAPDLEIGTWPGAPAVERLEIASSALSESLKIGIAALHHMDGVFVFLGDMPLIPHGIANELAAALGDHFAVLPRHQGRTGHPVLLSARSFALVTSLTGDQGAGTLLKTRKDVAFVAAAAEGVTLDIDRAEDIARLEGQRGA